MYRCTICDCQFLTIVYYRKSSWCFRVANPVRHDRCALSSALFYRTPVSDSPSLRYIIFSRTVKSTQCPIRAANTCEIVCIGIRCRRRAYLNRKIGMILHYYIFLIKYAVERRCIGTILTFRPAHAIVHSSRIIYIYIIPI